MATLIENQFASESQHWYTKTGESAYEVVGKNGKTRPTTLRDARELGLVPSVTSILALEAAPALTAWKVNQALLSAMTLPRINGEDSDSFMKRCLEDSRAQAKKAAERGTYLHGLLEQSVRQGFISPDILALDFSIIHHCITWLHTNFNGYTWSPERSFACEAGYGGKIDLVGESADNSVVIDYKFTAKLDEKKTVGYPNHYTQLAAYAFGLDKSTARCINLFIDSEKPGVIVPKEWTPQEVNTGWEVFKHLLEIWKLRRGL